MHAASDPCEILSASRRKRSRVTLRGRLGESSSRTCERRKMAATAAATGSRDYCVINANYRAVPCRRGTFSVGANRRVLCVLHVPGLPHSSHRKSDMTRRKKREEEEEEREERRSSVETE